MPQDPVSWQRRLTAQADKGLLRQALPPPEGFADFCSNDFLGLGQEPLHLPGNLVAGATGSRLVSGLHAQLEELEGWAADWLGVERVVYFPSGYQANLAVLQALTTRHDTLLLDERVHASIRDATRQTLAAKHFFPHTSLEEPASLSASLASKSPKDEGNTYLVTESIFSMTGRLAPLDRYVELSRSLGTHLIVDEAHSFGLYGWDGRATPCLGDQGQRDLTVRVIPLGKAAGTQGALVAGTRLMGQMLENFARPLIFSTAPSPILVASVLLSLKRLEAAADQRLHLFSLSADFKQALGISPDVAESIFPLRPVDETAWPELLSAAAQACLWVKPIRFPTVPKGEECLRITLHANQTDEEMERLLDWAGRYELRPLIIPAPRS